MERESGSDQSWTRISWGSHTSICVRSADSQENTVADEPEPPPRMFRKPSRGSSMIIRSFVDMAPSVA